jgi:hypothetical protein
VGSALKHADRHDANNKHLSRLTRTRLKTQLYPKPTRGGDEYCYLPGHVVQFGGHVPSFWWAPPPFSRWPTWLHSRVSAWVQNIQLLYWFYAVTGKGGLYATWLLSVFSTNHLDKYCLKVGWGSVVGIPTRYRLDGPEIESPGGGGERDFPRTSTPVLGPTRPPVQWVTDRFPGG